MRRDNPFRQPAIERLIERSADGLLHTIKCEDEMPKRKKRKECSEQSMEEIDICLNCTKEKCELDNNEFCARYRAEIKKRREKKHDQG